MYIILELIIKFQIDENIYEDSDDESQESESQNDIQANKNIKSSNRKIFSNKPWESDEEYQKNVQVSNWDSSLMVKINFLSE